MSGSLIINARDRLRWHQRLCSDASTLLMWGAWLKLWYPVMRSLSWVADINVLSQLTLMKLASVGATADVPRYAMALVGTSGTLLLWNRLPALKVRTPNVRSVSDYARHFELSEDEILAGRGTAVCVVHHDEGGRIIRVERRQPAEVLRRHDPQPLQIEQAA
jgi:poly-beta-1,6-N-acetyl-D-glucosamine biosynthesis protein PgaD